MRYVLLCATFLVLLPGCSCSKQESDPPLRTANGDCCVSVRLIEDDKARTGVGWARVTIIPHGHKSFAVHTSDSGYANFVVPAKCERITVIVERTNRGHQEVREDFKMPFRCAYLVVPLDEKTKLAQSRQTRDGQDVKVGDTVWLYEVGSTQPYPAQVEWIGEKGELHTYRHETWCRVVQPTECYSSQERALRSQAQEDPRHRRIE